MKKKTRVKLEERETDIAFAVLRYKLHAREDKDECKVPDLSRLKLVLIYVLVLRSKALYFVPFVAEVRCSVINNNNIIEQ